MARPTKEQKAKREAIKDLGLFVRDSEIYTYFEDGTKEGKRTPSELSYLFCDECNKRATLHIDNLDEVEQDILSQYKVKALFPIDDELGKYLFFLWVHRYSDNSNGYFNPTEDGNIVHSDYFSDTLVYKKDINKALGIDINIDLVLDMLETTKMYKKLSEKEEEEELTNWIEHFFSSDELISLSFMENYILNKEDKEKIKIYYQNLDYQKYHNPNYLTVISRNYIQYQQDGLNRNVYAELDLTKPIEELIEFVTTLKNDYDKDSTSISNFHRLIGIELEDHKCSTEICDIFKHKNPKPLSGKLMDVLFIYDCGIAGLDDDYISEQISHYWSNTKKIQDRGVLFSLNTIQTYRKFAKDYIDKKEYKNFIKGYVIPLD